LYSRLVSCNCVRLNNMTSYKLFREIYLIKRNSNFLIEHFRLEIVKFYQSFRVVLLQIHFRYQGYGAGRIQIRNNFLRIQIRLTVSNPTGSGSTTLFQGRVKYLWLDVIDGFFDLALHVIQLLLSNLAINSNKKKIAFV
jgi:hypothetical protein